MTTEILQKISTSKLKALSASLQDGALSLGLSLLTINQVVGKQSENLFNYFSTLQKIGLSNKHIALIINSIIETRNNSLDPEKILDAILSGPDLPGIPVSDTSATVQSLIEEAQNEILIIGYVVYQGKRIFERLSEKMKQNPNLRVTFCLDIARRNSDSSFDHEIVNRFVKEFKQYQWPWEPTPKIYYDPRSLLLNNRQRSSLHAKCVIADRKITFVTSANFTEAAQERNIELGILVRYQPLSERIVSYFEGLQNQNLLILCS